MSAEEACMFCGCTESMACVDAAGNGCSWVSHVPPVCSACARVWRVVEAVGKHPGVAGSFKAVKLACRQHREEGYRCG